MSGISKELRIARKSVFQEFNGAVATQMYDEFDVRDDAIAYWWALANCKQKEIAFIFNGADGYQSNKHLVGQDYPQQLAKRIQHYVKELGEELSNYEGERLQVGPMWAI